MAGSSEGTNLKRMRKDLQIKVCRTKGKSIEIIEPTEIQLSIDQNGQIADLYGGSKSRIWVNPKQKGIGRQFFCLCALASINKKSELHLHTTMNFQKSNPIFISTYLLNTQWMRYRNSNPLQRAEQSKRHLKIYYRLFILNVCNTKICMKKRRKKRLKSNCKKSNIVRKMHMEMDEKIVGEGCHSLQKLSSLLIKNWSTKLATRLSVQKEKKWNSFLSQIQR